MRQETINIYTYNELSDDAKAKARDWYREICPPYEWWDCVYNDAALAARHLGISIDEKRNWAPTGPAIYFSGFCNQGDGASFEGTYQYQPKAAEKLANGGFAKSYVSASGETVEIPTNSRLYGIAEGLQEAQRRYFYKLQANVTTHGNYNHSGCMRVEVESLDGREVARADQDAVATLLRDFADWVYEELEREHEFLNSDEVVEENILANDYEFLEDGSRP